MKLSIILIIILLLLSHEANSKSSVEVAKQNDGEHTLLFKSTDIFDVIEAQRYLFEKAQILCENQYVHYGMYEFNQSQLLSKLDSKSDPKPDTFTYYPKPDTFT